MYYVVTNKNLLIYCIKAYDNKTKGDYFEYFANLFFKYDHRYSTIVKEYFIVLN